MAPISNLDSERSVGSINYELKIRGAKQLKTASAALVKSKCPSQQNLQPSEKVDRKFFKMTESGGELPTILKKWEERQKELLKKGYKNLPNEVYANNLMVYLKRISSCVEVDMGDFKEALKKLEK